MLYFPVSLMNRHNQKVSAAFQLYRFSVFPNVALFRFIMKRNFTKGTLLAPHLVLTKYFILVFISGLSGVSNEQYQE